MSGFQIYQAMTTGAGTTSLQGAANTAKALEQSYNEIEGRLRRIGETLGEAWGGASSDAAIAAANPINQAMVQMQDSLRQADRSFSNQVYQFNHDKGRLKNVPQNKPDTGFWDTVTPWDTDTEDAVNAFNKDEAHNRQVYREYQEASRTNRGELPQEMAGITPDNLNVQVVDNSGSNNQHNTTNTSGVNRPSGTPNFPTSTGSPQGPGGSTFTPPPGLTGDQTTTSWVPGGTGGGGGGGGITKPGDLGLGGGKLPVGSVIDRPITAGVPPIGVSGGPGQNSGRGPGGAGKLGGGPGAGGAGKAGGPGGRFGTGGLGGNAGSGNAAGTQAGNKAGMFGGMGENANAANRGGAAGAAGRGGAAGMGGMGGHGAKGQGDEDKEHKSADYLVTEENTNELIGDMPMVAPPTIGG
ncbi:PPE domain-containing protein [Nocardia sp. NRRL S-836]|uniref:PPE domain-containing protein n=1 Tax=Nocardia sp. NRRL S-836 TaxID=1519492 RepID=UPI0006B00688|nr:PPE domain-containing protein [Nocardia sp. NRRL S-836]KOV82699.1 hypothetical protein ADL03_23285 [Nocardia sp. NRRL S-836]